MLSALWIAFQAWWFLSWTTINLSALASETEILVDRTASNSAPRSRKERTKPFLLGVTVDAGKHEFSVDWIRSFMDTIHSMGINTLHLTLASDQRFAFAAANDTGFEVSELKFLSNHARSLENFTILPEVSLPFFSSSWATTIPPLPCPNYICSEQRGIPIDGTNLPLDIRHSSVNGVLRGVFQSLVEGLGHPKYLHLGELTFNRSSYFQHGCWKEVLAASNQKTPDYNQFETMLAEILSNHLGYQPRILRSKQTGEVWEFKKDQMVTNESKSSYLLQPQTLNLATSLHKDHPTGWAVYQETLRILNVHQSDYRTGAFEGMVVSTQALPQQWFDDRNVMGRLLAIAMAVQDFETNEKEKNQEKKSNTIVHPDRTSFESAYEFRCHELFPANSSTGNFCNRLGGLAKGNKHDPTSERNYKKNYAKLWQGWAETICHNLTDARETLQLRAPLPSIVQSIREHAFSAHWKNLGETTMAFEEPAAAKSKAPIHEVFGNSKIPFRGFIVDLVDEPIPPENLRELMEEIMVPLGLNTIQLSLINHLGSLLLLESLEGLYHMVNKPHKPLTDDILKQISTDGVRLGIEIIPEISITTHAAGWYHAGFLVDCPNTMCSLGGLEATTNDVSHGSLLPVILAVIQRLRRLFLGRFLHLGSDERSSSEACWKESGRTPDYNRFERVLSGLLEVENWYNASNILRWENSEGTVYPERTGMITQYRSKRFPSIADDGHRVFGSISITTETNPWAIYQETREWVSAKISPRGLLARIQPNFENSNHHQYKACILAFAIGLSSETPILKDPSSLELYMSNVICAVGNRPSRLCDSPSEEGVDRSQTIFATPREQMVCKAMTQVISRPVMRSQTQELQGLRKDESTNINAFNG